MKKCKHGVPMDITCFDCLEKEDKFTPGTWVVEEIPNTDYFSILEGDKEIATTWAFDKNDKERLKKAKANAILIASAPDLLRENRELKEENKFSILEGDQERLKKVKDNAIFIASDLLRKNRELKEENKRLREATKCCCNCIGADCSDRSYNHEDSKFRCSDWEERENYRIWEKVKEIKETGKKGQL